MEAVAVALAVVQPAEIESALVARRPKDEVARGIGKVERRETAETGSLAVIDLHKASAKTLARAHRTAEKVEKLGWTK